MDPNNTTTNPLGGAAGTDQPAGATVPQVPVEPLTSTPVDTPVVPPVSEESPAQTFGGSGEPPARETVVSGEPTAPDPAAATVGGFGAGSVSEAPVTEVDETTTEESVEEPVVAAGDVVGTAKPTI